MNILYLDTAATAELTGISQSTLEKWRVAGNQIPFIKAGRLVRYASADVHAWMDAHRIASTSETPGSLRSQAKGRSIRDG